jgi:hypothetical protein
MTLFKKEKSRVRIESDGSSANTKIYVDDKFLPGVTNLKLDLSVEKCVLFMEIVDFEVKIDGEFVQDKLYWIKENSNVADII